MNQTTGLRIDQMYAFVAVDPTDDNEGVIAFYNPTQGAWMPMVGADMDMVDRLRPYAQQTANHTQREVRLLRFTIREEVEVFAP